MCRAHNIILMDAKIQEEYLILHARYLIETSVQAVVTEVQQERVQQEHNKQEVGELCRQPETENLLLDMDSARQES